MIVYSALYMQGVAVVHNGWTKQKHLIGHWLTRMFHKFMISSVGWRPHICLSNLSLHTSGPSSSTRSLYCLLPYSLNLFGSPPSSMIFLRRLGGNSLKSSLWLQQFGQPNVHKALDMPASSCCIFMLLAKKPHICSNYVFILIRMSTMWTDTIGLRNIWASKTPPSLFSNWAPTKIPILFVTSLHIKSLTGKSILGTLSLLLKSTSSLFAKLVVGGELIKSLKKNQKIKFEARISLIWGCWVIVIQCTFKKRHSSYILLPLAKKTFSGHFY